MAAITDLAALTAIASGDLLVVHDISAATDKKITQADFLGSSGTWTPRIEFGGATTGITYTTQTGQYQKIGSRVWIAAQIVLSSKGSATGNATIAGVPFTLQTIAVSMPVLFGSMTTSVVNMQGFFSIVGSASIALMHLTGAATSWSATTDAALSNTTSLYISGTFLTS